MLMDNILMYVKENLIMEHLLYNGIIMERKIKDGI